MTAPCPICGGTRLRPLVAEAERSLRRCRACGAVHLWPRPASAVLEETVDRAAARRLPRERETAVLERIRARNREILERLERRGCRGSLLDVGCGRGILMEDARRRGWRVAGVELAGKIAEEGIEERGLDIKVGTLADAAFPAASFDAVIFSHSLEHLAAPAEALREAAGLVRAGGWVYVETPHWGSLSSRLLGRGWWNVDPDTHLFLFSRRALEILARRAGLEAREFRGTHFDATAVLIRRARLRDPALNDLVCINELRDRLFSIRGAWRAARVLDSCAALLLGRSLLNDYLECWLQRPAVP